MRWVLLAAAVVMSACVGSSAPALEQVDALDAWDVGMAAGQTWQEDAYLVSVMALEHKEVQPAQGNESALERLLRRTTDAQLGDGLARVWVFVHVSQASGQSHAVAVGSTGVLASEVDDRDAPGTPLAPAISSAQAARALANETDWADRVDALADNGSVYVMLTPWGEKVVWLFAALDDDGSHAEFVDAATGTVLDELSFFDWRELGRQGGTSTVLAPTTSFAMELAMPHPAMALRFVPSAEPTLPGHAFRATLTMPDGQQVQHEWQAGTPLPGPDPGLVIEDVPAGDIDVTVEMTSGARSAWALAWCTSGTAMVPVSNEACQLL